MMTNERRMLIRTPGNPWSAPDTTAYENERQLQEILAAQPTWIPGVTEPVAVCLELPTSAGPIDVCIVSGDGRLTVVECKLASNSDRRRRMAQLIDYASAVWLAGPDEFLRRWAGRTREDLRDTLPDAVEALAATIENAHVDLCLVVDEIDDDLRRLVEYLNKVTRPEVRVTALQLAYSRQGNVEILVPSTFGGEIAETKAREVGRSTVNWTKQTFIEALASQKDRVAAQRLIELTESADGPRKEPAVAYGAEPSGLIFLTPGGGRRAPAWLFATRKGELTICGTWNYWPGSATNNHTVYSELATLLSQDEAQGAKGVRMASLDLDELWPVLHRCAKGLDDLMTLGS